MLWLRCGHTKAAATGLCSPPAGSPLRPDGKAWESHSLPGLDSARPLSQARSYEAPSGISRPRRNRRLGLLLVLLGLSGLLNGHLPASPLKNPARSYPLLAQNSGAETSPASSDPNSSQKDPRIVLPVPPEIPLIPDFTLPPFQFPIRPPGLDLKSDSDESLTPPPAFLLEPLFEPVIPPIPPPRNPNDSTSLSIVPTPNPSPSLYPEAGLGSITPTRFAEAYPFESGMAQITQFSQRQTHSKLQYTLRLQSASIYDTNTTLSATNKTSDIQLSLGPALGVQYGTPGARINLGAAYAGAANWYLRNPEQRTFQHNAQLHGLWNGKKLRITLRGGLESNQGGSRDTGERTAQRTYQAATNFNYRASGKTSVDVHLAATQNSFDTLLGSREFRTLGFFNYEATPKIEVGAGGGIGVLQPDQSASQDYTQALLRCATHFTEKVNLTTSGGMEWRKTKGRSESSTSPVFALDGSWQATGRTSLTVQAQHRIFASAALREQDYTVTTLNLAARETLNATVDTTLSAGYEHATYSADSQTVTSGRTDDYYVGRAGIHWAVRRWCDLGLFYEYTTNNSMGSQGYSFRRQRLGMSASISF